MNTLLPLMSTTELLARENLKHEFIHKNYKLLAKYPTGIEGAKINLNRYYGELYEIQEERLRRILEGR